MRKYAFCAIVLVYMSTFAFGAQAATVMIDPAARDSPPAGETLTVDVKVVDIVGLFGYEFKLSFDNSALKFSGIEEGEFLGKDGATTFLFLTLNGQMVKIQDVSPEVTANVNSAGALVVGNVKLGGADVNGTGGLVTITFEVLEAKTSTLELQDVTLAGSDALPIPVDIQNGFVGVPAGIKGDVNSDGEVNSRGIDREFSSWAIPPERSELLQNYPNPLNPGTWIPYQLKDAGEVTIRIYNAAGELVREIDLGYKPAGLYVSPDRAAHWDGTNRFGTPVASGIYFYSIQAGDLTAVRKLTVLK